MSGSLKKKIFSTGYPSTTLSWMIRGWMGRARLYTEIAGWSASTAGELRLQIFQGVRASLAKALVAADDSTVPDHFEHAAFPQHA